MGYTNYWTVSKVRPVAKKKALAEFVKKTIELSEIEICGGDGDGLPQVKQNEICFNGCDNENRDNHESFCLYSQSSGFCKTARKPYDVVVKSTLLYAHKIGLITEWSHDDHNNCDEYLNGFKLYVKTLLTMGLEK